MKLVRVTLQQHFAFQTNPFFLKFCSRVVFDPDSTEMFKGMYLPLDLWHILNRSGKLKGPKGGNVVTFGNVERTMNNTEFVHLLSKSWVGDICCTIGLPGPPLSKR